MPRGRQHSPTLQVRMTEAQMAATVTNSLLTALAVAARSVLPAAARVRLKAAAAKIKSPLQLRAAADVRSLPAAKQALMGENKTGRLNHNPAPPLFELDGYHD